MSLYSDLTEVLTPYANKINELNGSLSSWIAGKKISIIGDSIDTFNAAGYKIDGYAMYYPNHGVTSVKQTWWHQVITASGAELEVNASWSGSRVTNTRSGYPSFYDRVGVIGNPDVIFVTLGPNDSMNNVAVGEYDFETEYTELSEAQFRPAYIKGVKGLKSLYPLAKIILIWQAGNQIYKESIFTIGEKLGCICIDASQYRTVSGVHPGIEGMRQMARLVLFPLDATLKQNLPAEGKATGKAISDLNESVSHIYESTTGALTGGYSRRIFMAFEIGSIDGATGGDSVSTKVIRTVGSIPYDVTKGKIILKNPLNNTYKYWVYAFHPSGSPKIDSTWKRDAEYSMNIPDGYFTRVIFVRIDEAVVTEEEVAAITNSVELRGGDGTNLWMNQVFEYADRTTANELLKYGDPNLLGQEYQIVKFPRAGMVRGSFTRNGVWRDVSPFRTYTTDPNNPMYLKAGTIVFLDGVQYGTTAGQYRFSYDRWDAEGNHYNQDIDNEISINTTLGDPFRVKVDGLYTFSVIAQEAVTGDEPGFSALTISGSKTGFNPYPQERFDGFIKSVAHRGCWGANIAEANTLDAYKVAKKRGYIYVETDIQFTSDNIPVLSHDDKVVTNTDTIYISNITYDELMAYTIGTGRIETHITSLEELISWCRINGIHPYLELKVGTQEQIQIAWNIVAKYGMARNVSWISFENSGPVLTYVKDLDPKARLGVLGTGHIDRMTTLKTSENEVFSDANVDTLTLEYAQNCLRSGFEVEVYTINKVNKLLQVAEMGISGITTDGLHALYELQNSN